MNGFQQSGTELQKQAIVKRLKPAIQREDSAAVFSGIAKMRDRYGSEVTHDAVSAFLEDSPWFRNLMLSQLPKDKTEILYAEGMKVIAETIEKAGLRIEDHFRYCDRGIAVTHQAIAVIAATGFPEIDGFGAGNESLKGLGLCRSPFWHRLSQFQDRKDDQIFMNHWAAASMLINGVQDWMPMDEGDRNPDYDPEKPKAHLRRLVGLVAPTMDLDTLLYRSRYDDSALLKLCSLTHQAMESRPEIFAEILAENRKD